MQGVINNNNNNNNNNNLICIAPACRMTSEAPHCVLTDYIKITEEAGCAVYVCIWYCGPWQAGINDALHGSQSGGKGTERYQMFRHYRLSVSVFGRKSRLTFGGTYGFGRMC